MNTNIDLTNKTVSDKAYIDELKAYFKAVNEISVSQLYAFHATIDNRLTKETVRKRIKNLENKGYLKKIGRGLYTFGSANEYKPSLELELVELYEKLKSRFPLANICIWNTKQINEFMLHQPGKFHIMVETERDVIDYAFNFLKDSQYDVFETSKYEILEKYANSSSLNLLLKPLVSEAPLQTISGIKTATIEKILVDLYCDSLIFQSQQGAELETIFNNAFEKYTINRSRLLRYAARRNRKDIELFISTLNQQKL